MPATRHSASCVRFVTRPTWSTLVARPARHVLQDKGQTPGSEQKGWLGGSVLLAPDPAAACFFCGHRRSAGARCAAIALPASHTVRKSTLGRPQLATAPSHRVKNVDIKPVRKQVKPSRWRPLGPHVVQKLTPAALGARAFTTQTRTFLSNVVWAALQKLEGLTNRSMDLRSRRRRTT